VQFNAQEFGQTGIRHERGTGKFPARTEISGPDGNFRHLKTVISSNSIETPNKIIELADLQFKSGDIHSYKNLKIIEIQIFRIFMPC
jgi:hypothetical protein